MAALPEADYTVEEPGSANESSDDDDPFLDPYWTARLNVSKVAEPQPPAPKDGGSQVRGSKSKGGKKGAGKGGKAWRGYHAGAAGCGFAGKGAKGYKGGKAWKGKFGFGQSAEDIGDFVAWAKDPNTEDGNRQRSASRSPRRHRERQSLQDFMSWARESSGNAEPEEEEEDGAAEGLSDFLAWASSEKGKEDGGGDADAE